MIVLDFSTDLSNSCWYNLNMTKKSAEKQNLHERIVELEAEIKQLKSRKKYGLVWEDKPEDVVEQCKVQLPVLEEIENRAILDNPEGPTNILIEGDNYHALSVLNYTHKGKIDVIYIDPPYNTGASDWKYNNDYVDSEDDFRHTKWISFMEHRLRLCKNLLTTDGVICVTIDDYEMHRLWMLLEEIFGEENHLGTVAIRINPKGRMTKRKVSLVHEYAIFFGKGSESNIKKLPVNPEDKSHNYKKDEDGNWYLSVNLRKQGADSSAYNKKGELLERYYPIYYCPKTQRLSTTKKYEVEILPIDTRGEKRIWRRSKDVIEKMFNSGDITVKNNKNGYQIYFKFRGGLDGQMTQSIWYDSKFSASDYGTKILDSILGKREQFQYPKAPEAVKQSILAMQNKKIIKVLDFFAGSGTTGHAVLELNKEDGGNRQFILCTNNENKIAEEVTYPRVKNVIKGYGDTEGIPANLRYFKTDFVDKTDVSDDVRKQLVAKSTEMICLKESTFDKKYDNKDYKIYVNQDIASGILFNLDKIDDFKKKLDKIGMGSRIYVFSLSNDTYDSDFEDLSVEHKLSPIPESILEVYRKLFK